MGKVFVSIGMTLDGYVAGPNARPGNPLGDSGTRIHQWLYEVEAWRERQSMTGGASNPSGEIVEENFARAGAYVMGRRMFDEGELGWPDPPPFRAPVFVLTHHAREAWVRQGGTTFFFVTDGIEAALDRARAAAGAKDVQVSGGAETVREYLDAGLVDELEIHLAPIVLGDGVRLLDGVRTDLRLEPDRVVAAAGVTHVRYRVLMPGGG
ncbi:dihydrofolate reductase family protein [Streptomyces purpureus]|uniref:Deaminase reductase n=1 Tax=Streptomyces purpureus TaxID=1951 RepID=A0A918LQF0_9ACTN|nr:dihydrofolate reductase family protein [Streptomyces purpureus]GGT38632.1 deaminase reductase [Streptomyces purpureus]